MNAPAATQVAHGSPRYERESTPGSGRRLPGVRRIAVLRANAIGDFVFSLPALHALRSAYPEAQITLLGDTWHDAFLQGGAIATPVDRVICLPPIVGITTLDARACDAGALGRTTSMLRRERFDLAVQVHGGGRHSNPFISSIGAATTIGLRDVDAPPLDRWIRFVYLQSELLRQLEVVRLVGASVPAPPDVLLELEDAACTAMHRETRRAAPRQLAVVHPGASDPRRRWPVPAFADVVDALHSWGFAVHATGSANERPLVRALCETARAPVVARTDLDLVQLTGLLGAARIVVSNDTGPLHLAASIGTPSVGIYWAVNLINGGPTTRQRHRPVVSWQMQCPVCGAHCMRHACAHDASFVADIEPADVIAQASLLLSDTAAGHETQGWTAAGCDTGKTRLPPRIHTSE